MESTITKEIQEPVFKEPTTPYLYVCGYCKSTNLPVPYEQLYGPGAMGWDCCPDCGGV